MRIAHISDLHLPPLPFPGLPKLMSKRVFGYLNYVRNRASDQSEAIVEALCADLLAAAPDHIIVSGDLVNIALPDEVDRARAFLANLGAAEDVTVTLGNHDAYVPGAAAKAAAAYASYLKSDDGRTGFPVVRRRGDVVIVGLSTASASPPGFATGRVGADQLDRATAALERHADAVRVVAIHHPPDPALARGRRGLKDVDAVRSGLAGAGASLIVHGHNHRASLATLETVDGPARIVGVPSASSDGSHAEPSGYALYDIDAPSGRIRLTRRRLCEDRTAFATEETRTLSDGLDAPVS